MSTTTAAVFDGSRKVRHRTGAGARFNPDNIWLYRAVNVGVVLTALAAVLISWQGLVYVASWMELQGPWRALVPIMIDLPIVVFTLATLSKKGRGEAYILLALVAYLLTAVSAAANFLHVTAVRPLDTMEGWVGAILAALAPMLVLLTTEALGTLITKPPRPEKAKRANELRDTKKALAAANRELRKLQTAKAAPDPAPERSVKRFDPALAA